MQQHNEEDLRSKKCERRWFLLGDIPQVTDEQSCRNAVATAHVAWHVVRSGSCGKSRRSFRKQQRVSFSSSLHLRWYRSASDVAWSQLLQKLQNNEKITFLGTTVCFDPVGKLCCPHHQAVQGTRKRRFGTFRHAVSMCRSSA